MDRLQEAVAVVRAGDMNRGGVLLKTILREEPGNFTAWLWLSAAVETIPEKRYCLRRVLAYAPDSTNAKRGLLQLGDGVETNPLPPVPAPVERVGSLFGQRKQDGGLGQQIAERQLTKLEDQIRAKQQELAEKQQEIVIVEETILLQSFGFYAPKYKLENAEAYKQRLDKIRKSQADMVKNWEAATYPKNMTMDGNLAEGQRMVRDYTKIVVRSFNNECDASIINVKFNNVESIEKRIRKAFETLNKLGKRLSIALALNYLELKLHELYLCHEYQIKKQEEKEEQRRIREQMREEAKVQREIEEAKLKVEKEERHFVKALQAISAQLAQADSDTERIFIEGEKTKIEARLAEIEIDKADVLAREYNTRAGYVYIISNIGSFGEGVYKIGMTRRLNPQERIDELGDASVPFEFDVHAMVFSDDAPALENALHRAFERRRVNMINRRREFFRVTLEEIEATIRTTFSKPVEFIKLAEAEQYRESLLLRGETAIME